MKKAIRQNRVRQEFWRRIFFATAVLLLIHVVFFAVIRLKQQTVVAAAPEEELLRLWCMSSDDSRLTAEARDFIDMLDIYLNDTSTASSAVIKDPYREIFSKSSLAEREAAKLSNGIRLGWSVVTARLDGRLPALREAFQLEPMESDHALFMGTRSLVYDLERSSLQAPLQLGRAQADDNWKSGRLAAPVWHDSGKVWCSKYEDSSWQPVDGKGLEDAVARILAEASPLPAASTLSEVAPRVIYIEVLMGAFHGTRVHLRHSCGIKALDTYVLGWVLERHAWLGHHNTDAKATGEPRVVNYVIEVRQ